MATATSRTTQRGVKDDHLVVRSPHLEVHPIPHCTASEPPQYGGIRITFQGGAGRRAQKAGDAVGNRLDVQAVTVGKGWIEIEFARCGRRGCKPDAQAMIDTIAACI